MQAIASVMDEFFFQSFYFCISFLDLYMIKVSHENVSTSYGKNKINGNDIKDEHMFTLVILKRHVVRLLWLASHHDI
jgi:hypothetical protein